MRVKIDTEIRSYYTKTFPTDELGFEINGEKTFFDLFECLKCREDVYEFLGVGDSLIRERLFSALAKVLGVDYEYIYQKWLAV